MSVLLIRTHPQYKAMSERQANDAHVTSRSKTSESQATRCMAHATKLKETQSEPRPKQVTAKPGYTNCMPPQHPASISKKCACAVTPNSTPKQHPSAPCRQSRPKCHQHASSSPNSSKTALPNSICTSTAVNLANNFPLFIRS